MKLNITKKNVSKALYGAGTVAAASLLIAGASAQTNNTTQTNQNSDNTTQQNPENTSTSLGDFPQPYTSDNQLNSIIVYGESASETDVNSARNLAETLYSETGQEPNDTETSNTTSMQVPLTTENERLYLGSGIDAARNILTEDDLEPLRTTEFNGEEETEVEQFLRVGNQNISFGRPDDDSEPFFYIQNPVPSQENHLYELEANMDSPVDFTSEEASGEDLSLFGRTFSVSSETNEDELVLLTGQRDLELRTNQSRTVTVDGTDHTFSVVSVNDGQVAMRVDGELEQYEEDESFGLNDASMRVEELIDLEGSNGIIRLSAGSTQLTFSNGQISSGGEEISGLSYSAAGGFNELESLSIFIGATDDDSTWIREGESYTSNLFSPSLSFEGFSRTGTSSVEVNSGETTQVSFNTSEESASIGFSTAVGNSTVLGPEENQTIATYQNQSLNEDDYIPTDASGISRLWRIEGVDADENVSEGQASLELQDELSGASANVELEPSEGIYKAEKVVDGRSFRFYVTPDEEVSAVWDPDTTPLFPALQSGQSAVAMIDDVMLDFEGERTFRLPATSGEPTVTISSSSDSVEAVSSSPGVETRTENDTVIATVEGGQEYGFRIQDGQVMAGAYSDNNIIDNPSLLIVEPSNSDNQQESYVVETGVDDEEAVVNEAYYSGFIQTAETDDEETVGYDRFGARSLYDEDDGGFELSIPETQAYAELGFTTSTNQTQVDEQDSTPDIVYNASNPQVSELSQDSNVILVGGPAVNSLTQELASQGVTLPANQYSSSGWLLQSTEGFGGNALIVAGTTAEDTASAADFLSNYRENSEMLQNRSLLRSTEVETN
ncbi:MAG: S-layer protein [Nanohaloarchaea archaeon]|nr:S-layer protein [Candidatus Nanohaloarchaea archaeon]